MRKKIKLNIIYTKKKKCNIYLLIEILVAVVFFNKFVFVSYDNKIKINNYEREQK